MGTLLRCPGGQVETVPAQVGAGVKWAALNIGTDPCVRKDPSVWAKQRGLYKAANVPCGPWMHVRSQADLEFLIGTGAKWNADFIGCNLEDVVSDKLSLQQVGGYLLDFWVNPYQKPVHLPTLPWVQNEQGWQYVSFATFALEMFPEVDPRYLADYQGCIDHAFKEGAKKVTLLYSTQSPRSVYPNVAHCLYTADNVTSWPEWKDSVPQVIPKEPDKMLTPNQKKEFRAQLVRFALVAEKYEKNWHYTQARPYTGLGDPFSSTHHNDCSSYVALLFYSAGRAAGFGVHDPLDEHYSGYGNTQTAYEFLKDHKAPPDKFRIGDLAIYGPSYDTVHITMCRKAGTAASAVWSSFGQEAGPEDRQPLSYHPSPLLGVYRHPALL